MRVGATRGSVASVRVLGRRDAALLDLLDQCRPVEAEQAGGAILVPVGVVECLLDQLRLEATDHRVEVDAAEGTRGAPALGGGLRHECGPGGPRRRSRLRPADHSRSIRFLGSTQNNFAEWLAGSSKNQPYETVEKRDDWDHVQQAVSSLPLPQRVVVVLYYLNDLSLQEISEILDVPVGTVKSRLHYGRQTLKKNLGLGLGRLADADKLPDLNYERP